MNSNLSYYLETFTSDEAEVQLLQATLKNPEFEIWTYETFQLLIFDICGLGGNEAHDLSIEIASQFMRWYKGYTQGWWNSIVSYKDFPSYTTLQNQIESGIQLYYQYNRRPRIELIMLLRQCSLKTTAQEQYSDNLV